MHYIPNLPTGTHTTKHGPGQFEDRAAPLARDFRARAFTIGIGGPVGSGKTALLLALCRHLRINTVSPWLPMISSPKRMASSSSVIRRCRQSGSRPSKRAVVRTLPFATM